MIEFESQPRRTVFAISLPLANVEQAAALESDALGAATTSGINAGTRS